MFSQQILSIALAFTGALLSASSHGGTWGEENWGQMYWGNNPISEPTIAPIIESIVADGDSLIVTIGGYAPGQDGWSAVTGYRVTCGAAGTVVASSSTVRIEGLESDTQYECFVEANNAVGSSPVAVQVAMTDAALQGLNLILIRAALCRSGSPPKGC